MLVARFEDLNPGDLVCVKRWEWDDMETNTHSGGVQMNRKHLPKHKRFLAGLHVLVVNPQHVYTVAEEEKIARYKRGDSSMIPWCAYGTDILGPDGRIHTIDPDLLELVQRASEQDT